MQQIERDLNIWQQEISLVGYFFWPNPQSSSAVLRFENLRCTMVEPYDVDKGIIKLKNTIILCHSM